METFSTAEVVIHTNGVIRIYGDGGLLFEVKGNYVKAVTYIDPQPGVLSGEAVKRK